MYTYIPYDISYGHPPPHLLASRQDPAKCKTTGVLLTCRSQQKLREDTGPSALHLRPLGKPCMCLFQLFTSGTLRFHRPN